MQSYVVFLLCSAVVTFGDVMCDDNGGGTFPPKTPSQSRLIIADVDVGADDAWALFALLRADETAAQQKLLAITCVTGNAQLDQVAINVARLLQVAKRPDIPVYKGAARGLIQVQSTANAYQGIDGLGDLPHSRQPVDMSPVLATYGEHAVNALQRLTNSTAYRNRITLVCTAPLTNIALDIRTYGDAFVRNVRDIWIMGGNNLGVGNVPDRLGAEFNFYSDPEAAYIVLDAFTAAGKTIRILPWEACSGRTLPVPIRWRNDVLGRVDSPIVRWLNPIEKAIFDAKGIKEFTMCDALLVGSMLFPEQVIEREDRRRVTVELQGANTRGQMVVDYVHDAKERPPNVDVIGLLNAEAVENLFLWVVGTAEMDVCVVNEGRNVNACLWY